MALVPRRPASTGVPTLFPQGPDERGGQEDESASSQVDDGGPVGLEPTTRGLKESGYRLPTGDLLRPPRTIAGAFAQFISTIDAQLRSGSDPVGAAWLEGFWRGWRLFNAEEQRR